ncbi:F-type H+-transporting ATPase subunit c [Bacilli bacterium PM5-3]|nr:F-type H+-transporting ATPase subunit c [Bacilli bacterium PM5-3]MDH6603698.1 F-type H+-transporting ATPase subunit c [Bacilli bacterium PM5-9]MDH6603986.1 F-type H+-transporting ATPase subunit c [Bacilli bacterium PM5-9]
MENITDGLIAIGAGLAVMTGIGTGAGQGVGAGGAAQAVGRNPEAEGKIRTMLIIGQAVAESSALYGLLIALILIFTKMS